MTRLALAEHGLSLEDDDNRCCHIIGQLPRDVEHLSAI